MATFEAPTTWVNHSYVIPDKPPMASLGDLVAMVSERVSDLVEYPEAFASLPVAQAALLWARLTVYKDVSRIPGTGVTDWIAVVPSTIKAEAQMGLQDLGIRVVNSAAPQPLDSTKFFSTQGGTIPDRKVHMMQRSVLLTICMVDPLSLYRAADALYMWAVAMCPVLQMDFASMRFSTGPLSPLSDQDKQLFSHVPGRPLAIPLIATNVASFTYSEPSPPA